MQKILHYTVAGICADVDAASTAITQACRQPSGPYRVRGVVQAGDHVYLVLLSASRTAPETYHFVEVCDAADDELVSTLNERWTAGFDTVGSVSAGDGLVLVLFSRPDDPA